MGRKRTGTLGFRNGRYFVALTVDVRGGGTARRKVWLPRGTTPPEAEKRRVSLAEKAVGRAFSPREEVERAGPDVLFEQFVERWIKARRARGLRSVRKDEQRLRDHVTPVLLGRSMRSIRPDDLRAVVAELDRKVRDPEIVFAWKTAAKTWGAVTKLFADSARSKDAALRVLPSNPCDGVEGPDRGYEKASQWLYPSEFALLVGCPDVPLRWRRIYAIAAYLYLRVGELRALRHQDIDIEHGMVLVQRSADERGRGAREFTKTGSVRHFRIEPALLPVLRALAEGQPAGGRLFESIHEPANELRAHLKRAGVTRAALHESTATSMAIRFHDLRATGITWAALRGDPSIEIRDRAGHAELEQTNAYMRRAAGAGDVGTPFPPLDALVGEADIVPGNVPPSSGGGSTDRETPENVGESLPAIASKGVQVPPFALQNQQENLGAPPRGDEIGDGTPRSAEALALARAWSLALAGLGERVLVGPTIPGRIRWRRKARRAG